VKQGRNPESIHQPVGRYVHQIEVSSEARMLFVSGQVGMEPGGDVPADTADQFVVALNNVVANVEAAGFARTDIVKLVTYVVDSTDIDPAARRGALDAAFGSHFTTSTLVYVSRLATPQYLVEIDAWAVKADEADA
jgi:enamine deaminase RidA (YjgF/YER057c/UK114 family)